MPRTATAVGVSSECRASRRVECRSPAGTEDETASSTRSEEFARVLAEYGPFLGRMAAGYERNPARRDELMQDIALAIWQALPGFESRASLRTFVARIAHNRAVSHVVRESRDLLVCDQSDEPAAPAAGDPAAIADAEQQRELLMRAVRRLPLSQRQVMMLALEGFSNGEIADALELSPGNVAVRLTRARASLSRRMSSLFR